MAGVVTAGGVLEPPAGFWDTYPPTNTHYLITFDTDTTGANILGDTTIENQYLPWGVTFNLVSPQLKTELKARSADTGWGADYISHPDPLAPFNTLSSWDKDLAHNGPLWVRIDFLPAYFPYGLPREAGFVFTDSPHNDDFTLKAYDINNILVDSAEIAGAGDTLYNSTGHAEDRFIGVTNADGIRYMEYSSDFMWGLVDASHYIIGTEIDDVSFEVRFAPEPATLLLMGLGSLALIGRRIRKHRSR
jgi:hypothetical protein